MDFKGKRVLVAGTGLSGISAARLLEKKHAEVILYDGNEALKEADIRSRFEEGAEAEIVIGELPDRIVDTLDLAVFSPGIPLDIPAAVKLKAKNVKIWGEIELAYQAGKGRIAAITGTNGKTTTTALVGEIMKNYFDSVYVVGNIGTPYTGAALEMTDDTVTVAEVSSFQLETIENFRPDVSAILNITPDHLDRHKTMENYIAEKEKIAMNQRSADTCVLNFDDAVTRKFGEGLQTKVLYFSRFEELQKGVYLKSGAIYYNDGSRITEICRLDELKLLGSHNHENVMAAAAIGISMGVPMDVIRKTVREFVAVEHRIEYVAEKNGVKYYNDSKGTNPDAAIKGIQAMVTPTLLIGGGYDKNSEYEEWIEAFDGKVKLLVLIGQTREKIAKAAADCGFTNVRFADSLEEAVKICAAEAVSGDSVLLSPACASWGMFKNYEERGRMFKEYVYHLEG